MNNKIKIGVMFMALFFVLSSQAKRIIDIDSKGKWADFLKLTKNIDLRAQGAKTLTTVYSVQSGSCLLVSNSPHIKKTTTPTFSHFSIKKVLGSIESGNWVIRISTVDDNVFSTDTSLDMKCILPGSGHKSREQLTTDDITKASNGLIKVSGS